MNAYPLVVLFGAGLAVWSCNGSYDQSQSAGDAGAGGKTRQAESAGASTLAGDSGAAGAGATGDGGMPSVDGCRKDNECKGGRICVNRDCIFPSMDQAGGVGGEAGSLASGKTSDVSISLGTIPGLKSLELFAGFYDARTTHISAWAPVCTATASDLGAFQEREGVYVCDQIPQPPLGQELALNYHLITSNFDAWGCYGDCSRLDCPLMDYAPIGIDGTALSVDRNGVSNGQYGCNYVVNK